MTKRTSSMGRHQPGRSRSESWRVCPTKARKGHRQTPIPAYLGARCSICPRSRAAIRGRGSARARSTARGLTAIRDRAPALGRCAA